MKVALACGGTGGHIFPGIATASVLRERGHEVVIWLSGNDVETTAASEWDGPVEVVRSEGFDSRLSGRAVRKAAHAVWRLAGAARACTARMRAAPPSVVLGMGSYASVGPAMAARRLGVPIVLHEANVIPGRAVRFLSRRAAAVAAAFEETRFYLKRRELVVTGMPLRRRLLAVMPASGEPHRNGQRFTLLILGGSRGASALNRCVAEALALRSDFRERLRVVHLTGEADASAVEARYHAHRIPHEVHAFHHDMAELYLAADLAICRSGASTCAELLAFGVPSLLVPYPHATRNHQLANARAMEKVGAAHVIEQADLESDWLADYVAGSMAAPDRLRRMRAAARQRARVDAADALAALVERTGRGDA